MREATPTVLQANSRLERGAETTLTRSPVPVARRPLPGVLNLGGPGTQTVAARPGGRRDESNGVSQAGQAFADLLLVGSTASRCPLALLTVMRGEGWSTLSFGAERDALEDPELFSIIAGRREPVEVTDPGSNPALAHSRLARSNLGIRWLLAIPLLGPSGDVNAIFSVLDTEPRELSRRERAAMVAIGRLVSGALSAHRATDSLPGPPGVAEHSTEHQADGRRAFAPAQPRSGGPVRRHRTHRHQLGRFGQVGVPAHGGRPPALPQRGRHVLARGELAQTPLGALRSGPPTGPVRTWPASVGPICVRAVYGPALPGLALRSTWPVW